MAQIYTILHGVLIFLCGRGGRSQAFQIAALAPLDHLALCGLCDNAELCVPLPHGRE